MSWEKEGAKDWDLPGYGKPMQSESAAEKKSNRSLVTPSKTLGPPDYRGLITPTSPFAVTNRYSEISTPSINLPLQLTQPSRPDQQPVSQSRLRQIANVQPVKPPYLGASELLQESPAKQRWRQGLNCDAVVRLPAGFPSLRVKPSSFKGNYEFLRTAKTFTRSEGRERTFELISQTTGAYISQANAGDRHILIWGEPKQVAEARDILLKLIEQYYGPRLPEGSASWSKVHPEYTEDVERTDVEKTIKDVVVQLREAPDDRESYPKEMLFIWPRSGPSPRQSLGNQLEKLDVIRKTFKVHIFLKSNHEDYISVCGNETLNMEQVAAQLREQWKAAIAKSDVRVKAFLVEPGRKRLIENKVTLVKKNRLAFPLPPETQEPLIDLDTQDVKAPHVVRKRNDQIILQSFHKALSQAHFFAGYLRMRLHFGSFVLDRYRKPTNHTDGYTPQEFREMMCHERVLGRLVPGMKLSGDDLLSRCMSASSLFAPMDELGKLSDMERAIPTYAASFEFTGPAESQFRLEVDFRQRALEIEQGRHRWFKAHSQTTGDTRRLPLQVSMVDFSRSDWQGDIELFEPLNGTEVKPNLVDFLKTVRFDNRIRVHGMTLRPRQKVLFNSGAPLESFTEKASIRLQIRRTKYVFELARFDHYTRTSVGWVKVPTVSWGATLYDPNWDTVLGSGLLSGEKVQKKSEVHVGSFESFFPTQKPMDDRPDDHGFWELMDIVDQISAILGPTNDSDAFAEEPKQQIKRPEVLGVELGTLF
ncbi:uncharacterized protein N7483_011146 [Penicillium malachiteum]|uniref:uncharacterized protein n=1 Tax=Penicillium malachiteum TaxID=1324776 RepID=UPI002546895E|nr:uncharacterized protein N7483_011146 [Penicillium malachiteum]KAJ5713965.1 hypothetical protein N7483_011146 [Penicillium malachiteum]